MGVCYDGVEGLLYLSLFSLLAACALSVMLCATLRMWTLMGNRSAPGDPLIPLHTACSTLQQSVNACTLLFPSPSPRDKEYDDIDEEDPFNPQARRMSYNPRRSNIHSFCSYTSSHGSQSSLQPPPQAAANVVPAPEYM